MNAAFLLMLHILVFLIIKDVLSQSPPQLAPEPGAKQKIISPGSTVTLPCPVSGDRAQMLFEWSKDKESVTAFGGHRIRVTGNGALRIKETVVEDTGVYTCRAVNGFGSVEHNTTLIVLDDNEEEEEEEYEDFNYSPDPEEVADDENKQLSKHEMSAASKPRLIYVTEWNRSHFHKLPGSSVQLHCVPSGWPKPVVSWTKDGGELPRTAKRGRWSLLLQNLQLVHSGNYTCRASNQAGATSHSFYIDVTTSPERLRGKPEMTAEHPSNTTVEEGQTAVLQCIVRSMLTPHIEWLKRVEPAEMHDENFRDVIQVGDENFRVIKSSEVIDRSDDSYFNKLVIHHPAIRDTGKYICLGANTNGYSFKSAFLNVLPKPPVLHSTETLPFPIVVAVIVLGVAGIAGMVALMVYCRNRRSGIGRSSGSTTAVPMVTKDSLIQHHHRPMSSKACSSVIYEPPSLNHAHHQVTVYVPSCQKLGH